MNKEEEQRMLGEMKKDKEGPPRKFWSPPSKKEGTFPVRFIPPLKGEVKFYFTHNVHWVDGLAYECINQTLVDKDGKEHLAEECPICRYTRKLYNTSERDTPEWKMANSINAKTRYSYRVVVRGSDDETKPVFFESGRKIFENLYNILIESDYGNIIDAKNGRDFNIVKKGTGQRSNYDQSLPAATTSPIFREPEKIKAVLGNAMKMAYNSLIEFRTFEVLEKALKESLGITTTSSRETSKVKEQEIAEEPDAFGKGEAGGVEPPEEKTEDDAEDEIDAILSEFIE